MGSLDDTLRLEAGETSPLQGETPFPSAVRPTASGLQWLDVPSGKAGWAFRIVGGTSLERLAISGGGDVSVSATASIHAPATHVCTSFDGRLVAVICIDGSMECFDATSSGLESRWIVPNCHSHITNDLSIPPSDDRSKAASASGPVRSFAFAPSSYELLLVDSLRGSLAIYNAANSQPSNGLTQNVPSNVLSAAWSSTGDLPVLALGKEDGSIEISRYQQNSLELLNKMECPNQEEEGFCCTHLDWSNEYLLVGLCKVEPSDEEPDEDDEDDAAEHEAAMYMTSMDMASFSPGEWHELGDVVPFFGVPRGGRHAFFTSFVHSAKHPLCVVASNVGTDVAVLAEEDGNWAVIEFEEGNEPTTPTDDEDEFSFPTGVGVVPLSSGFFQLLLPTTDGSLSTFTFQKEDDPEAVKVATALAFDLDNAAVEIIESTSSPPDLTEEPPVPELAEEAVEQAAPAPASSAFSFGSSSGSSAFTFGSNNATDSKPVFGTGSSVPSFGAGYSSSFSFAPAKIPSSSISDDKPVFGSTPSKPTFGSTSTFGSGFGQTSPLFGQSSPLGGGGSSTGSSSIFGQTSSVFGAPKTPEATAAPAFGATSTPSSGPVFGSGTKAGTSGGFAALSSSSPSTGFGATFSPQKKPSYSEPSVFESMQKKAETETSTPQADTPSASAPVTTGFPTTSNEPIFGSGANAPAFTFGTSSANPFTVDTTTTNPPAESPFNAFGSSKLSPTQGFMAKPLFGTNKAEEKVAEPETPSTPKGSSLLDVRDDILSSAGKVAARVFGTLDEEKIGSLPIDYFEDLSEELGEGFHGDEYDKQIAIIDPTGSGSISRAAFIDWYTELVEGDDDDGSSISSGERAEREEERQNALEAFQNLSGGNDTIPEAYFPKLIESLNTVYSEEGHRKTLKLIARGGEIHQLDFLSWYVGWLFRGDESSDDEDKNDASDEAKEASSKSESLSAMFAVDKDSWKCEVCSVQNKGDAKKCVACESVRPGFEDEVAKEGKKATDSSGSAIGKGGFSFGGSSSSGGIGSGGFTFGAPAAAGGSTTTSSGSGFTFGAPVPAAGGSTTTGSGSGFTFGAKTPSTSGTTASSGVFPQTASKAPFDPKRKPAVGTVDESAPKPANPFSGISLVPSKPVGSKPDAPKPVTESGFTFRGPAARTATPKSVEGSTGFSFTPPKAIANTKPPTSDQTLSTAGKAAARVFDTIDEEKTGSLPIDSFESLSEELGEGLHGDEYDKQIAIMDPSGSGKITRAAFINWYTELVENNDDDGSSMDSEERAEREEERQKAEEGFKSLSADNSSILSSDFPKLMESLGTAYCEEEHRKTLKKISKDGTIHLLDFLSWYVDWLFGGDESSDDEDDDDDDEGTASDAKGESSGRESLSAMFAVDKDSWKCEVCSVQNKGNVKKCVACEEVRPGFEDEVAEEAKKATDNSGSAIGKGGFSFGGSSSSGGIGSGGFTFGAPAAAGGSTTASSGSGFTFGAPAPAAGGSTTTSGGSGFTFGAPAPAAGESTTTSTGPSFTFGAPAPAAGASTTTSTGPGFTFGAKTPSTSGTTASSGTFPPIASKAPFDPKRKPAVGTVDESAPTKPANPFSGISLVPSKPVGSKTSTAPGKDEKPPNPFAGVSLIPSKPLDGSSKKTIASEGSASSGSAAFPPMSAKAPTPFKATTGSTSAASTKATSGSSAAFPPMSAKAPTPFSAKTSSASVSSTKATSGSSAAFPPMSAKAPTPFSAKTSSTSVSSTKATSSGSAAFPPMSAKAPTPFSATTSSASVSSKKPTSSSSAAFPPMSTKAPTPFSATTGSTSAASTKATSGSSAAFPPMSTKAPTPFSAKTASTSAASTKATTSASSAAFPPMSSKAPTPFSASTTTGTSQSPFSVAPKATPSVFGISSTKAATSTSSAVFPPMSSKAPTPFSASTTTGTSQSSFSVAPKATQSVFGSSPPPMAATLTNSAAFPPMSSKAPTPFGGGLAKESSIGYPPVSSKAPTPFSATSTTSATKASASSYPPVASKAPTPFGAKPISASDVSSGQTTAATAASPLFSQISSTAPTPFGGDQPATKARNATEKTTTAVELKQSSQLETRASPPKKPQDRLGISNLRSKLPKKMPAAGMKLLELTEKMERVLNRVGQLYADTEMDEDFEGKIQSTVDCVQNHRVSLTAIGTSVGSQRQTNTFLMSREVDSERQIKETRRLVNIIATESSGEKEILAKTQPLDYESEADRRKFAATSVGIVGTLKLAHEKIHLLEAASQSPHDGSNKLADSIVAQYQRTMGFKARLDRIEGKLEKANQSLPLQEKQRMEKSRKGQSTYGLITPRKQRPRPVALAGALTPLSKLTANRDQNASSARKWNDITSSLQRVGNKYSSTVRVGGTSRLRNLRRSEETKPAFKSPSIARSLLLSPSQEKPNTSLLQSSSVSSATSITIFSPKSKTKARAGWDTVSTLDQVKVRELSFSLPGELKEATLTDASRHKLERLGTTPEKVKKSISIKQSQSAVPIPTRPQDQVPKAKPKASSEKKAVPSAAFPPMSNKAPTPFSKTTQKSTDSKPPMKPRQEAPFPPVSTVAPKPFSPNITDSKSTAVPKKGTPPVPSTTADKSAAKSDPFSTKSMGDSLFSSGGSGSGSTPSPFQVKSSSESVNKNSGPPDYNAILVTFYQKHNPAKVADVGKTLEKFKGREIEMFQKLAAKYKVKSPLDESQNAPSALSGFGNPAAAPSSNAAASPFQSSGPSNTLSTASPFSSGTAMNTGSTFGKPPASPFGPAPGTSNMGSSTPFGSPAPSSTPFGPGGLSSASPFGGAPNPSPFGNPAVPAPAMQTGATQNSLQGKDPRQMLLQFYQQYNPSKLGEVDKVLTKYKGNEEQLFRNLAKKYKLDASAFGLPPAPAAGGFGSPTPAPTAFGQASTLGGTGTFGGSGGFGQSSQMGFGSTNTGSGMTFGSGMSSAQGTSSFGSLAQAPSPSPFGSSSMSGGFGSPSPGFGATSSMGFGGSTPFGAPRR